VQLHPLVKSFWTKLIRFGQNWLDLGKIKGKFWQNQNIASPKTFDLLRLCCIKRNTIQRLGEITFRKSCQTKLFCPFYLTLFSIIFIDVRLLVLNQVKLILTNRKFYFRQVYFVKFSLLEHDVLKQELKPKYALKLLFSLKNHTGQNHTGSAPSPRTSGG